jgi:tripartite-type tricarboxylate transporter receptor subunit TctC
MMMKKSTVLAGLTLAISLSYAAAPAPAQSFPSRPVRVIVPLPAGGAVDTVVRAVSQKLMETVGHNFVVDNRPSAGGSIALETTMAAAPDGYTIAAIGATQLTFPLIFKARYELLRDFYPVSQLTAQGYVLTVHPSLPVRSVPELVQHLTANPGKLNFASSGIGGPIHLNGELFMAATGTRMTHVPYKGMAIAYAEMLSGSVEVGFPTLVSSVSHLRANRLRALAVTTPVRVPSFPELPTMAEAGVPGVVVTNWYGIIAPSSTPRPIVERLNRELVAAIRHPDIAKRLAADGSEAVGSSSDEFRAHIAVEREKWARVIRDRGIRAQ